MACLRACTHVCTRVCDCVRGRCVCVQTRVCLHALGKEHLEVWAHPQTSPASGSLSGEGRCPHAPTPACQRLRTSPAKQPRTCSSSPEECSGSSSPANCSGSSTGCPGRALSHHVLHRCHHVDAPIRCIIHNPPFGHLHTSFMHKFSPNSRDNCCRKACQGVTLPRQY